ncbi:hypothetical protein [Sutcliffiella horikoshii]|uniref:hypothetical protein n=1 Tax=Sutcliffiella horikoshii TaxID=79883 RepID=UPI001CFE85A3|nr:hypothetical protein [Sutcliffiella horikoshii]
MNKKLIKESLDHHLEEKLAPIEDLQSKILLNTKNPQGYGKRYQYRIFFPVLGTMLILLLLIPSTIFLYLNAKSNEQTSDLVSKLESENNKLEEQLKSEANSEGDVVVIVDEPLDPNAFPEESKIKLLELGFEGEIDEIKEQLLEQTQLIPYEPVLGGIMSFREDRVKLLSHEWIFAPFDDGHTGGFLLIKYQMRDGKVTDWDVMDSYKFGD